MRALTLPATSVHAGNLILVNGQHPHHKEIDEPVLAPVIEGSTVLLERRAAVLLTKVMYDIGGWAKISPVSGFRSNPEQRALFEQSLRENGTEFTERFVAKPGHSEHQTGLAIDLGRKSSGIDFIRPDFPYHGICQTFRDRALAYGFIERYPEGKERLTGIAHEPWHFRYVGAPHAAVMAKLGLTLEEYHDFLKQYPHGRTRFVYQNGAQRIAVSYLEAAILANDGLALAQDRPYTLSGNNTDGYIFAEWLR